MELNEFVANFANQFDDTDPNEIKEIDAFIEKFAEAIEVEDASSLTPEAPFRDLEEWSSLTGMGVIALAKTLYGKTITGKEIRACDTVEDVFNLIASK